MADKLTRIAIINSDKVSTSRTCDGVTELTALAVQAEDLSTGMQKVLPCREDWQTVH